MMNTHGLLEDDIEALAGDRQAIADRLLREIEIAADSDHRNSALGELRGWIRAGGPAPNWSTAPAATRRFHRAAHGLCEVPWLPPSEVTP